MSKQRRRIANIRFDERHAGGDGMIKKTMILSTRETNPYHNLALEEYLLLHVREEECILYLWQNRHTVVIGRNQNCWRECRVEELERDGGFLVRRLSGGGAVYHDLGNLNFTFLVRKSDYDTEKQLQVILKAVQKLEICAEKTGRNDITVDGRKFSGNAFYQTGDCCYHHGTLLLHADKEMMSRFLNVSGEKLKSKGVASVRSRVANLSEFCPDVTVEKMEGALREAFGEVYGCPVTEFPTQRLEKEEIRRGAVRFASAKWKYGRKIPFQAGKEKRFSWGELQIWLDVDQGTVQNAEVFSDAMDETWIRQLKKALCGCRYEKQALALAAAGTTERSEATEKQREMAEDAIGLLGTLQGLE